MKKSNIILILTIAISIFTIFFVIIEARWKVDEWMENITKDMEKQETVTLKSDIKTLIVRGGSKVEMEMNNDKNWITDRKPFGFHYLGDVLEINKKIETRSKTLTADNKNLEAQKNFYMRKIDLGLTDFERVEVYDSAALKMKKTYQSDELFIVVGQSAWFTINDLEVKNIHIQCYENANVRINSLRCDSLFITSMDEAKLKIRNNSHIKYASGTIKGDSEVRMPRPKKLAIDTDNEAYFKMY